MRFRCFKAVLMFFVCAFGVCCIGGYAHAGRLMKCRCDVAEVIDWRQSEFGGWCLADALQLEGSGEESPALSLAVTWTMDTSVLLKGGVDEGSWAQRNLLDVFLDVDAEQVLGIERGQLMFHFQNFAGEFGSADVGDLHVYSNIDNDEPFTQVAEVYWQQELNDAGSRVLIGKIDANAQFNYSDFAGEFLASGKGNNPTIYDVMPTYPNPSTAVVAFWVISDELTAGYGLFDGRLAEGVRTGQHGFDLGGPFWMVGELQYTTQERQYTRWVAGVWHHTFNRFERFDGSGLKSGMSGFYLIYDRILFFENPCDEEDEQGLYLNLTYGLSDEDTNTFPEAFTAALIWRGPLTASDRDAVGIGVLWGDLSDDLLATQEAEIHAEFYARRQINDNWKLQPVVTYINQPAAEPNVFSTWVGTLRIQCDF